MRLIALLLLVTASSLRVENWEIVARFHDATCSVEFNETVTIRPQEPIRKFVHVLSTPRQEHERAVLHNLRISELTDNRNHRVYVWPQEGVQVSVDITFNRPTNSPITIQYVYEASNAMRTDSYFNNVDWPVCTPRSFSYELWNATSHERQFPSSIQLSQMSGRFSSRGANAPPRQIFAAGECSVITAASGQDEEFLCPARELHSQQSYRLSMVYEPSIRSICPFDGLAEAYRNLTMMVSFLFLLFACVCVIWCAWCRHRPVFRSVWSKDDYDEGTPRERERLLS